MGQRTIASRWACRLARYGFFLLAAACDGPSRSFDTDLARLAANASAEVEVIGSSAPVTLRWLRVALQPANPLFFGSEARPCPVLHASGTVNGLPLQQVRSGGHYGRAGETPLHGGAGCEAISFQRALEGEPELEQELTTIRLEDASALLEIEAKNIFAAPEVRFETGSPVMQLGSRVDLSILPDPGILPLPFELAFQTQTADQSFDYDHDGQNQSDVTVTPSGLSFPVPDVVPGEGVIRIRGLPQSRPFRGLVTRCELAARCSIVRVACVGTPCEHSASLPTALDRLELPARTAAPQ